MEISGTTFGQRLRRLRLDRGWEQRVLARKAGSTQANISRIERDQQVATWDMVQRLASALGVTPMALYPEGMQSQVERDAALLEAAREKVRELAEMLGLVDVVGGGSGPTPDVTPPPADVVADRARKGVLRAQSDKKPGSGTPAPARKKRAGGG